MGTNLGTGMRASVHVDLPGYTKEGVDKLKARCEELAVQPRGTRGESGGQTGHTYDISNKHRLGYSEVQLVQVMIDAVNTLWKEDVELQKKHVNPSITTKLIIICFLTLWAFTFWTQLLKLSNFWSPNLTRNSFHF